MENPDSRSDLLTPYQKKIVAAAITGLAFVLLLSLVLGVFYGVGQLLGTFATVIWPLAIAGIITLLLKPLVSGLQRRFKMGCIGAIVFLYSLVILVLTGIALLVVPLAVVQGINLVEAIPGIYEKLSLLIRDRAPDWLAFIESNIDPGTLENVGQEALGVLKNLLSAGGGALKVAGQSVADFFTWTVSLAIIPVYLFFFLQFDNSALPHIRDFLPFLKKDQQDDVLFLIREFVGMIVAFFRGQILIALIMGLLMGVGFTACGLKSGFLIGLTLGMLNLIPYLGTILGIAVTLPLAYFQPGGGPLLLLLVIAIMVAVQMIEGWLLTPKIMGNQTGLHPVAIIFSVFFWGIALGGLLGMILAIPLTAFFVTFWRLAKIKYIPMLVGGKQDSKASIDFNEDSPELD